MGSIFLNNLESANEERKETRETGCAITCKMLPSLRAVSLNL
jgi:hypothetical protein